MQATEEEYEKAEKLLKGHRKRLYAAAAAACEEIEKARANYRFYRKKTCANCKYVETSVCDLHAER